MEKNYHGQTRERYMASSINDEHIHREHLFKLLDAMEEAEPLRWSLSVRTNRVDPLWSVDFNPDLMFTPQFMLSYWGETPQGERRCFVELKPHYKYNVEFLKAFKNSCIEGRESVDHHPILQYESNYGLIPRTTAYAILKQNGAL